MAVDAEVIIVGGGLAGLACAGRLQAAGVDFALLEAADRPGGRIRTDRRDGFLFDRGFQVLQTAYPESRRQLDYAALNLRAFNPGHLRCPTRPGRRRSTIEPGLSAVNTAACRRSNGRCTRAAARPRP